MSISNVRALVLALALGTLTAAAPAAQDEVSLRGQWRLDASASDMGDAPSDGAMPGPQGGRAPLGGGMAGPTGSPFGGMRGRPPMDPDVAKQRRELVREVLEPVVRFTLEHDASVARFTYPDGRQVSYRTNGKSEKHQATNGVVETETRWRNGALMRETHLSDGLRVVETFTRTSATQLTLTITMSGGPMRRAQPMTRVYELESDLGSEPQEP